MLPTGYGLPPSCTSGVGARRSPSQSAGVAPPQSAACLPQPADLQGIGAELRCLVLQAFQGTQPHALYVGAESGHRIAPHPANFCLKLTQRACTQPSYICLQATEGISAQFGRLCPQSIECVGTQLRQVRLRTAERVTPQPGYVCLQAGQGVSP